MEETSIEHDNTDAHDINMNIPARVIDSTTVYTGAIFSVEDRTIALTRMDESTTTIRRQVIHHAPCVVMLVHDVQRDMYVVEREYRAGCDQYTVGLPAGLIDDGEDPNTAVLRELREETGIVPDDEHSLTLEQVGQYYSSEGMTDELAHIYILRLQHWHYVNTHFDTDEHIESTWVTFNQLEALPVTASNSIIAIQAEHIRRMKEALTRE